MERQNLGKRLLEVVRHVRNRRIVRIHRIERLHELAAEPVTQNLLDLHVDLVAHRRVVRRVLDHVFAHDADAHAGERLPRLSACAGRSRKRRVRPVRNQPLW